MRSLRLNFRLLLDDVAEERIAASHAFCRVFIHTLHAHDYDVARAAIFGSRFDRGGIREIDFPWIH